MSEPEYLGSLEVRGVGTVAITDLDTYELAAKLLRVLGTQMERDGLAEPGDARARNRATSKQDESDA